MANSWQHFPCQEAFASYRPASSFDADHGGRLTEERRAVIQNKVGRIPHVCLDVADLAGSGQLDGDDRALNKSSQGPNNKVSGTSHCQPAVRHQHARTAGGKRCVSPLSTPARLCSTSGPGQACRASRQPSPSRLGSQSLTSKRPSARARVGQSPVNSAIRATAAGCNPWAKTT